ncbi:P-type conjugative transfer protein TrbG [Solemya pervernicosa gill symbiont]|uniref:P-type conjugative transfer protein TrbG n=1 Tax=Solemya pervernicosa gill symbiont TaxID=642797 RepID=A0A1T2KZP7_9GAMM|nr:P-type conjugative transfer protein TrbG [Solemya pervernicosa gill symbiont]OOZ38319.1 P-type conjugative transfer protein TrbG [Solemya pervernicosa gill symbiont]
MKIKMSIFLTALLATQVSAGNQEEVVQRDLVMGGKDVALNSKESKTAKMAYRWIYNSEDLPVMGDYGKLIFLFGRSMPTIICAPLHACDVELQSGEKIYNVHLGDRIRWKVSPAVSGPKGYQTAHAIIKPTNIGLETTLVITTDRRTYHMNLKSRKEEFMPYVGFDYPEETQAQWEALITAQKTEHQMIQGTRESLTDLDFEYSITGDARWKPVRVYNNGVKTIIQMPKEMAQTEAPALLVLGADGDEEIVNYRLKGDRYIIDYIFDRAELIAGVGSSQIKIVIDRTEQ